MKRALGLVCLLLLGSCSTIAPPSTYSVVTPSKQFKTLYHETIGLVEAHKQLNSIAFAPQILKPLSKNILTSIHGPAKINETKRNRNLFTKKEGHDKHVKFYLPTRLKSAIQALNEKPSFTTEVITTRGKKLYECTKISIQSPIPNIELVEVHLYLDDKDAPLSPSETLQIMLPIGKKEQILIPQKALQKSHFAPFVYVVDNKGSLEKRKVKLGHKHGDQITVLEGLSNKDQIVISR